MGREKEGRERNLTQRDSALELNQSSSVHNGGAFRKEREREGERKDEKQTCRGRKKRTTN